MIQSPQQLKKKGKGKGGHGQGKRKTKRGGQVKCRNYGGDDFLHDCKECKEIKRKLRS